MIRVTPIANSEAAKKYFSLSDYLVEGQEMQAHWHGKGAAMLGLTGPVNYADFEQLCDNINPVTGTQLTGKNLVNRRVGYDWTFSVPKSVSVAFSLGLDDRLPDAFRSAVAETMAEVEREMEGRVRKDYANENRRTGNMIWADFLHSTSRPIKGQPDPQLHVHAVVFNATYDREELQWKAGEFAALKANAPYFQAVFRARLATKLQDMGYGLRKTKDDFELSAIPARTITEFSRRTTQIEKLAEQLGIKNPVSKAKLGATSRDNKVKGLTWEELLSLWADRVTPDEQRAIRSAVLAADVPLLTQDHSKEALDWSILHLFERSSVVKERELVTTALKHGLCSVTPESIYTELGKRKDLIRRTVDGVPLVSTKGVLAEERKVVDFAVKGRGRFKPLGQKELRAENHRLPDERSRLGGELSSSLSSVVSPSQASATQPDLATLSPSQLAAIRHVWTSPDRLILIRGAAGTGKTTLTKAALAGVNVPWVILAPSAEASRGVLRRDGFDNADTLAKFLVDDEMQQQVRGGLIWLDEASLAGARDIAHLVQLADQLDARIVLSGDRRQHKSVARGDILALLEDKAKLPVAEVSEIKRQAGEYKSAVEALASGKMHSAFAKLDKLGWVKEADHSVGVNNMVADDYLAALRAEKSVLVISPTHAEGEAVTAAIREKLKQDGRLKGEERTFERLVPLHLTEAEKSEPDRLALGTTAQLHRRIAGVGAGTVAVTEQNRSALAACPGGYTLHERAAVALTAGDAIRITANGKSLDGKHRLNNGATYTVSGFTDKGDIRLNNGWTVSKDYGHIAPGYVVTSYASQGKTVDRVLIAQSSQSFAATGTEQFYVSVSRGKERATVYTDDKEALREAIQKDDHRHLASDLVRQPRRGLRERLKRHLGFLRRVASPGRDHTHQPQLEYAHERI